jgi:hypothetical protein
MKKWFLLRGVEYATDFKTFLNEQIFVVQRGNTLSYNSRLESYQFALDVEVDEEKQIEKCRQIHYDLLQNKFGVGKLID